MLLEGSCHCGAVRFSVESPHPYPYQRCYCSICRKTAGGGGYAINLSGSAETLLVWGASDRLIVPAYAQRWQALIPHARLETIGGAGHMLPYEQPEAFGKAVAAFLA